MKRLIYLSFLFLFALPVVQAQSLTPLDSISFPNITNQWGINGNSDCWGYTAPDGTEYAFIGTLYGVHVVRVPDMTVIDSIRSADMYDPYYHRDIKTYRQYAYIVSEMYGDNEGLSVVDLSYLPDSVHLVKVHVEGLNVTSHNLSIDTAMGYAYVLDAQADGVNIFSLSDPENPTLAGYLTASNVHDVVARNDTAWVAEGYSQAYSVWNCSNKSSPTLIARITDPNFGYAHNIWPDKSGRYFFTTEETDYKTVKMWDMSNPLNVVMTSEYSAPCSLAHNAHVEGDYLFLSYYTCGVRVVDFSNPANMQEVAFYDTYTLSEDPIFEGTWGVFPHNPSGYVYTSNFEGKLMVFQWTASATAVDPAAQADGLRAWPNPASGPVQLSARLSSGGEVSLEVFDMAGRSVHTRDLGYHGAGELQTVWTPPHGGVFNVVFHTPDGQQSVKVVSLR